MINTVRPAWCEIDLDALALLRVRRGAQRSTDALKVEQERTRLWLRPPRLYAGRMGHGVYEIAAGEPLSDPADPIDGYSLLPLLKAEAATHPDRVYAEMLSEGTQPGT